LVESKHTFKDNVICYTIVLYTLEEFNEVITDCLMIGMLCWSILKRLCCVIM